jgi:acyl-CoA thioesterase I
MKNIAQICLILAFLIFNACDAPSPKEKINNIKIEEKAVTTQNVAQSNKKTIIFFGNSLSAAFGIEPSKGFVGLTEKLIDSLGLPYKVVNAGLSGETTAGGKTRIGWILRQPVDIFVLELGGNDALRGIDPADSYKNLKFIIEKVIGKYHDAKIVIAGMEAPPNLGPEFTSEFREMYSKLAKEFDAALIPFLLKDVGGIRELNLPDGIHPTPEGHQIVAENVWVILKDLL